MRAEEVAARDTPHHWTMNPSPARVALDVRSPSPGWDAAVRGVEAPSWAPPRSGAGQNQAQARIRLQKRAARPNGNQGWSQRLHPCSILLVRRSETRNYGLETRSGQAEEAPHPHSLTFTRAALPSLLALGLRFGDALTTDEPPQRTRYREKLRRSSHPRGRLGNDRPGRAHRPRRQ